MMRWLLMAMLATFAAGPLAAQDAAGRFTPAQRDEIVAIVRDALRRDPSILRDATAALQADDEARQAAAAERRNAAQARGLKEIQTQADSAEEAIARINSRWDAQPRLIDQSAADTRKLNAIIAEYSGKQDEASKKVVADAIAAREAMQDGLNRPFEQFMQSQRESVATQSLILRGRDEEAAALQDALRLQEQGVRLDDTKLAQLLQIETQQKAIAIAMEDQRRIVGLYVNTVGEVQRTFDQFLATAQSGKAGKAVGGLFSGLLGDFQNLQRGIISDRLFGGLEREVEDAIKKRIGGSEGQTPAELLRSQVGDAGAVLKDHVADVGTALDDLVRAFHGASAGLSQPTFGTVAAPAQGGPASITADAAEALINSQLSGALRTSLAANDNDPLHPAAAAMQQAGTKYLSATESFGIIADKMVDRVEGVFGKLPTGIDQTLRKNLGPALEGASYGGTAGGLFGSITGGKTSKLGSEVGGALGEVAGKALGKTFSSALGSLGGAAGPLGAIAGGILGGVIGGLFKTSPHGASTISSGADGKLTASAGFGNNAAAEKAAATEANAVIRSIDQISDALGATITAGSGVTVGTYKGKYRVQTAGTHLGGKNHGEPDAVDFGDDQQGAITFAVQTMLEKGVITGISQASIKILQSGQDLQTAINKALLIEQIPRDLKAILDPVGEAIDDLNRKWKKTVDALKEGGASAEQMAQAEQLYNLQLDQAKKSATSATQTLEQFRDSLNFGSSSALSLRDQEAAAKAALQPFLDQISAGTAIDQSGYQDKAQSYLDIERQLYGSEQGFFDAQKMIQDATNHAISTVESASSISGAVSVESPFAKATADSAAATASNTATSNDLLSQVSGQLGNVSSLLSQAVGGGASNLGTTTSSGSSAGAGGGGGFIGSSRGFKNLASA